MTKYVNDIVLDAPIDKIITDGDLVLLFDVYSEVYATLNTNKLGSYVPTITKANGDVSGRKGTLAASTAVSIIANGNFNHYAVVDTVNSVVLYIGDGTVKALNTGDTVDTPVADIEFSDPA